MKNADPTKKLHLSKTRIIVWAAFLLCSYLALMWLGSMNGLSVAKLVIPSIIGLLLFSFFFSCLYYSYNPEKMPAWLKNERKPLSPTFIRRVVLSFYFLLIAPQVLSLFFGLPVRDLATLNAFAMPVYIGVFVFAKQKCNSDQNNNPIAASSKAKSMHKRRWFVFFVASMFGHLIFMIIAVHTGAKKEDLALSFCSFILLMLGLSFALIADSRKIEKSS